MSKRFGAMLPASNILRMTILISVLVSAFTTLAIEWFAKPTLEARKERILEEQRKWREALRACREMLVLVGLLSHVDESVREFRAEARKELAALAKANERTMISIALLLPEGPRSFAAHSGGLVRGVVASDRSDREVAEALRAPVETLAWILETHRGFSLGRRPAARQAAALMAAREQRSLAASEPAPEVER